MEWLKILKCPITGNELRKLSQKEIDELNEKVLSQKLWHPNGKRATRFIKKGLITVDGTYIYPIINEILILLKELAFTELKQTISDDSISAHKQLVKDFYDEKGRFINEERNYKDAVIFEDLRPVAKEYVKKCHDRVNRYLNQSGTYMLDAASGALQFDDYLQYSTNYKYRVCVDFSFQALSEAKRKLGSKGIYILADITNMPFKDGVMDSFISLNTIYHIPKDEQLTAIKELYRVLAAKGKGVVVYEWFKHSQWMNIGLLPFHSLVSMKNSIVDNIAKLAGNKKTKRILYYYAHNPNYFKQNLPPFQLKVWRSLSVHFMRYYIHSWLFGKQILQWIHNKEEANTELCGLKGEYPMLVFEK